MVVKSAGQSMVRFTNTLGVSDLTMSDPHTKVIV